MAERSVYQQSPGSPAEVSYTRDPGALGSPAEWHLIDYFRLLSKRRWTAILSFLAVVAAVTVVTITATPIYEATAELLIEAETQNIITFKEVVEQDKAAVEYYQTQYKLLQSRALAKATLDKLQYWDHPEFSSPPAATAENGATTAASPKASLGVLTRILMAGEALVASVFGATPSDAVPPTKEPTPAEETAAQSNAIQAFLSRLTVAPVRNSRLVDVKFRSTDPKVAAAGVNALAQAFMERNLEFKFQASKQASDWLTAQLSEQRKQVEQTEVALQRYREENSSVSTEDPQVVQKLTDLNAAVTRAKTERIQKEAKYNQIREIRGDRAQLEGFPVVMADATIQKLKVELVEAQRQQDRLSKDLGDRHPQMIEARAAARSAETNLNAEINNAVASVYNDFLAAEAQERSLLEALSDLKNEALALNRKAIGYRAIERDATSNRQIFDVLLQRAKETGISGELRSNNIRLVDEADLPRLPVWPDKWRNFWFALLAGAGLAVGLAFFAEYLDNKIKSPEEIREHLRLPCLGLVPQIGKRTANGDGALLINNGVPPVFAEAFRGVRTNVLFSCEEHMRSVAVMSTAPGEGKTLVASNLAAGLALAGQSVLLIDADMRRPQIHHVFGRDQAPGLSNLLVGTAKATDTIRETDIPGLWVLPAGSVPANPAELLSSQRFERLLTAAGKRFDRLIIDSSPVMAVTDASIVAHAAGAVLFVVAAEHTSLPAAMKALEQLDSVKANFLGVVLNRVNFKRNKFFYAPYFRSEYTAYYGPASGA